MAHAVLGAVVGHFSGNATVGAISAFTAEAAAPAIIKAMGWDKDSLTEKQKQTVSALATLAAGLAGGLVGDSSSSAVAGAQAGKNAVENNSLGMVAGSNLGLLFADTSQNMEIITDAAKPNMLIIGGITIIAATPELAAMARSALVGCQTNPVYCLNSLGIQIAESVVPAGVGAGGAIGLGRTAAEATAAKAEAVTANAALRLPKPGNTSIPNSGAGAEFTIDSAQLGKKLGKHVEDFGGNASNAADRKMVLDKINDIGNNAEKIIPGTFSGQGANGLRGDVFFRIKGNDVVVTKPDGTFVTVLKDGVTNNTSVKNALRGNP
ncbi:hypothetical protein B4900_20535 [Yersinia rohdei]|nr:hypothetical protein B4900_20535 [Yersinia rohdei]